MCHQSKWRQPQYFIYDFFLPGVVPNFRPVIMVDRLNVVNIPVPIYQFYFVNEVVDPDS